MTKNIQQPKRQVHCTALENSKSKTLSFIFAVSHQNTFNLPSTFYVTGIMLGTACRIANSKIDGLGFNKLSTIKWTQI